MDGGGGTVLAERPAPLFIRPSISQRLRRTHSKSGHEDCQFKKTQSLLQEAQRERGEDGNDDEDCALHRSGEAGDAVSAGGTTSHGWGRRTVL